MRKLYFFSSLIFVLISCSKDDTATPEPLPEPVQTPKYTVTIKAGDGGTISTAGGTYDKDSEVSVTATPNAEYLFQAWSDGSTDNPRTIKVGADLTITANFVKKQYDLTINIVGEGTVSEEVSIQGSRYNSGSQIKLTATATEGWEFSSWSGDIVTTENPITVSIEENQNITANFQKKDTDNDGISDDIDQCPDTPDGEEVDENGCSVSEKVYLDDNGITIKCRSCENGEIYEFEGVRYIVLDDWGFREYVTNNSTVIQIITTLMTDMQYLFYLDNRQLAVDQLDFSRWDVSNVENMEGLFMTPYPFYKSIDDDLSFWDVSKVNNMSRMFENVDFNGDLKNWNVSNVTDISRMFLNSNFNQDISSWDISKVTNMGALFYGSPFNQDISEWDVSGVKYMGGMFKGTPFNQDISSWDTRSLESTTDMFKESAFNQDISSWNVENVRFMNYMFSGSDFNQNISNWKVSKVENMSYMFKDAKEFNQDLSSWNTLNVKECSGFMENATAWTKPKPIFVYCNPE